MGEESFIERTQECTPKKRAAFLDALSVYGNVTKAAEEAGLGRFYLYRLRNKNEKFRAAWDKAAEIGAAALEDEAKRRAFDGWEEPVFYQGNECGTVRKFSDTLLIFLLKGHMPGKYQERQRLEHIGSPTGEVITYRIPDNGRD